MSIGDEFEEAWNRGARAAYATILETAGRELEKNDTRRTVAALLTERARTENALKALCRHLNLDADWPDGLHLADVVAKYIMNEVPEVEPYIDAELIEAMKECIRSSKDEVALDDRFITGTGWTGTVPTGIFSVKEESKKLEMGNHWKANSSSILELAEQALAIYRQREEPATPPQTIFGVPVVIDSELPDGLILLHDPSQEKDIAIPSGKDWLGRLLVAAETARRRIAE